MSKSLLFIPDISGFTNFVQTTEVEHSQHVISELLEVLIAANTQQLKLAEIEGDALFFFKENEIPSQEKILAQVETMYTAFYSHLKMLETNRICPCNACATAPKLQLKIILHCGDLQFLNVQGNRKPFGESVIEAHRLLKNSIEGDNYILISEALAKEIKLTEHYESALFQFDRGSDKYDGKIINYLHANIDVTLLKLRAFEPPIVYQPDMPPNFTKTVIIDRSAYEVYEMLSNYRYRHLWVEGVDEFVFEEDEVTRVGTEHTCVINGKSFDFTTVVKPVAMDQLNYGELTFDPPPVERMYQFFTLKPLGDAKCELHFEIYWKTKTPFQKMLMLIGAKKQIIAASSHSVENLVNLMNQEQLVLS
ncbi:DUF2652 domain-containing protein [Croceivirga thetidis]|uniref:DUF2652 domain-containing protein n=1 Tax=Croceivirga thetidis TaxID=2721623 RepID=A0ABX1GRF4_9FLAO|nr:DUF2652 domain-containing protein [Croceivirga thetidis]NKI32499.1 DUF2652 domain-containing protein [Croceivirga thetidis]